MCRRAGTPISCRSATKPRYALRRNTPAPPGAMMARGPARTRPDPPDVEQVLSRVPGYRFVMNAAHVLFRRTFHSTLTGGAARVETGTGSAWQLHARARRRDGPGRPAARGDCARAIGPERARP